MIPISGYLSPSRAVDLAETTRDGVIAEMCALLAAIPEVPDPEAFRLAVMERERALSTGIGLGIAVPHAKISSVADFVLAVGRSRKGIEWQALDSRPVHLVVLIAGPGDRQARYLQILASVTLRLKAESLRRALLDAADPAGMLPLLGA